MAVDKRGRKLPKGIRQRGSKFEGRFMYKGMTYIVHASTVTKVQKEITELKYKLEHGYFVTREKVILDEWFKVWLEEYKKNRVKIGTYTSYEKYYRFCIHERMGEMFLTDIRGVDVQKFYNDLVKDGYALSPCSEISSPTCSSLTLTRNGVNTLTIATQISVPTTATAIVIIIPTICATNKW